MLGGCGWFAVGCSRGAMPPMLPGGYDACYTGCSAGHTARRPGHLPAGAAILARVMRAFLALLPIVSLLSFAGLLWPTPSHAADEVASRDATTFSWPGPHPIEEREVVIPRADGSQFEARLFIPLAVIAHQGARAGAVLARSPVVAFGHGYLTSVDAYASTLRHLASWGITVVAPRSGGELFPDHASFAADLATAADRVSTMSATEDDWPGLVVDPEARGVSGHSMGGGAAVLAATTDPRIQTVATLAAADTRPSAIDASAELAVPALFVAASDDTITPLADHQRPMFEATSGAPGQLRTIEGGSHCGFLDQAVLVGLICDRAAIDGEAQRGLARAALTAWLRYELAGDESGAAAAWPDEPVAGVTVESTGSARRS